MAAETVIKKTIDDKSGELANLSRFIHANPETGLREELAARRQEMLLKQWGFTVDSGFILPTAFRATSGEGAPTFCIASEYDALPRIGHACGHNLIAGAALGAGIALAEALKQTGTPGTVIVMGTPAEEGLGGKIKMLEGNAFDGVDAVIMAHPGYRTSGDPGGLGVTQYRITFHGEAAHAAAMPEMGKNALDAVMLLFSGVNSWRQHLPEASRVHGIVTEGGTAPNIIPDRAGCFFYLRSTCDEAQKQMCQRMEKIAEGAALMTGTMVEINQEPYPYAPLRPNLTINKAYTDEAAQAGMKTSQPDPGTRFSTDFGNLSQVMPGSHLHFQITEDATLHSESFADAAISEFAERQMLLAAEAMARVGFKYLSDPDFRKRVDDEFSSSA